MTLAEHSRTRVMAVSRSAESDQPGMQNEPSLLVPWGWP